MHSKLTRGDGKSFVKKQKGKNFSHKGLQVQSLAGDWRTYIFLWCTISMQVWSTRQAAVRCFFYRHTIHQVLWRACICFEGMEGEEPSMGITSAKSATLIPSADIQSGLLKYHKVKQLVTPCTMETCGITSPSFSSPSPNSAPKEIQPETSCTAEHPPYTFVPSSILPLSQRGMVSKYHHRTITTWIPWSTQNMSRKESCKPSDWFY